MWRCFPLLTLSLLACHRSSPPTPDGASPATTHATLRGQVVLTTQTYCGGARPPENMELSKRAPAPGKRVLVRRGSLNTASEVLAEVTSNEAGAFTLSLPPGTYCFIEEAKRELAPRGPPPENVDARCLESWRQSCDAVIEVPATGELPVTLDFHEGCLPRCSEGPFPP